MINSADIIIVSIILVSALISLFRGFIREALSLITWGLAFWVAINFYHSFSEMIGHWIVSPPVRNVVAFLVLFVATLMLGGLINYLLGQVIDRTGLVSVDRVLGIVFGVLRGGVLVAVLLLIANLTSFPQKKWWHRSVLIPKFQPMEVWVKDLMPEAATTKVVFNDEE